MPGRDRRSDAGQPSTSALATRPALPTTPAISTAELQPAEMTPPNQPALPPLDLSLKALTIPKPLDAVWTAQQQDRRQDRQLLQPQHRSQLTDLRHQLQQDQGA